MICCWYIQVTQFVISFLEYIYLNYYIMFRGKIEVVSGHWHGSEINIKMKAR